MKSRVSLLERHRCGIRIPQETHREAAALGLSLASPAGERWSLFSEFHEAYSRDSPAAGVLLLEGSPVAGGSAVTGIPFTDERAAEEALGLSAPGRSTERSARRFWSVVRDVQAAQRGAPLEGLFDTVHLAHAVPFTATRDGAFLDLEETIMRLPSLRDHSLGILSGVFQTLRPQMIVPVGRLAYEAAASLARNRHDLAARIAEGFEPVVLGADPSRARTLPAADFDGFRALLVPLADLGGPLSSHSCSGLARVLRDAWV